MSPSGYENDHLRFIYDLINMLMDSGSAVDNPYTKSMATGRLMRLV